MSAIATHSNAPDPRYLVQFGRQGEQLPTQGGYGLLKQPFSKLYFLRFFSLLLEIMSVCVEKTGEILLELTRFGTAVRVVAVDTVSRCEVRFSAPLGTPIASIEALAARKIAYVLERSKAPIPPGYA